MLRQDLSPIEKQYVHEALSNCTQTEKRKSLQDAFVVGMFFVSFEILFFVT